MNKIVNAASGQFFLNGLRGSRDGGFRIRIGIAQQKYATDEY